MSLKQMLILALCLVLFSSQTNFNGRSKLEKHRGHMNKALIKPPSLKEGDSVAIVAPAGILINRADEINKSKKLLQSWGLKAILGKHVFSRAHHFAGTDEERTGDLQQALDDPSIKAIWCARGGYGTVRILDKLNFSKFKLNPKWIIGYSDITVLHNKIHNLGIESIHGMMCMNLEDSFEDTKLSVKSLKKALLGEDLSYSIPSSSYNKAGRSSGVLVGGNLTLLHTMLGSNTSLEMDNKILFIEEIGEYKYHIDRMLQSLKRAGYFNNCAGIIVGDMSRLRQNTTAWGSGIEELILDILDEYNFPVLFDFPAGHEKDNRALILGRTVDLTVGKLKSKIVFKTN